MLELQSISKRLGSFSLADVSLRVEAGKYFTLLGPTGVGKTIMLEIIAGLIRPDRGTVRWGGRDITRFPPEARGFALMYQDYALFPHMSVIRNIAYGRRGGGKASVAMALARDMMELLAIDHLADRAPETLSGGEKQRVALARALVIEPQLLLLDEPLASLDLNVRDRLREVIRDIHRRNGTTILHVTHDVDEALCMGKRIGVMLGGRLQQTGTPEEVFIHPTDRQVAEFLGLKNVLAVDEIRDGACIVNGLKIDLPGVDPSVTHLWIRPEELILSRRPFDSSARNQFRCRVVDWEHRGGSLAVRVEIGKLTLIAMITHASHREMAIAPGSDLYCTFKSSAVHWFQKR
ncbi:MAG: ABC transporter ATP-binding protein [Phycisphaerales bacterium]|nr:MAG: ABC transporter ATP-binding protein [Phycisphaerales bacterium]